MHTFTLRKDLYIKWQTNRIVTHNTFAVARDGTGAEDVVVQ
jgi:hypothetical protein